MIVTLKPTEEITQLEINGADIPARVWSGKTETGLAVELFVLSIVAADAIDTELLKMELPIYFFRTRDKMIVGIETTPPPEKEKQ